MIDLVELEAERPLPERGPELVRALLYRIQARQRRVNEVKQIRDFIIAQYSQELAKLEQQEAQDRETIRQYLLIERNGESLRIPDAGTVYLRKAEAKILISDQSAVEASAGRKFEKLVPKFDESAAKAWAQEQLTTTGEIPAGCEFVPETQILAIKK